MPRRALTWLRRHVGLLATLVALAPFVAAAVGDIVHDEMADRRWGDMALIELATGDVGNHAVLLGPYSRFGWHHPGPTLFYLLALPYRLIGSNPVGIALGGALITGVAAAGSAWIAYRRGAKPLLLWTLVVIGLFGHATGRIVADAWNPWVTILPFALAVLLAWSVACRDVWAFPALVGIASFIVQSHVGYLPTVVVVFAGGTGLGVLALVRARHAPDWDEQRRRATAAGAVGLAVAAALWALPVVEQFVHRPGNLTRLVGYWEDSDSHHRLRRSMDVAAAEVGVIAGAASGDAERPGSATGGLGHWTAWVSGAALAGTAAFSARRRWWDLLALAGLTAAAWGAAAYSLTRVDGPLLFYLTAWIAALGIPLWIAVGGSIIRLAAERHPNHTKTRTAALITTLLVIAGLAVVNSFALAEVPSRTEKADVVDAALAVTDTAVAESECGPIRVRVGRGGSWVAWAVVLRLDRQGVDFGAERSGVTELHLADWYLVEPADQGTVLIASSPDGDPLDVRLRAVEYPCAGRLRV
jgi:hypothetical protein